jgi:hypothetical protein
MSAAASYYGEKADSPLEAPFFTFATNEHLLFNLSSLFALSSFILRSLP